MTINRVALLGAAVLLAGVLAVAGVRVTGRAFEPTGEKVRRSSSRRRRRTASCSAPSTRPREKLEAAYQAAVLSTGLDAATVKKLQDYENRNQADARRDQRPRARALRLLSALLS